MKKTFWTMWLLVAAGVGFVACRGGDAEGFETADLPADSLTVEGFSGYTSWMRQGDKVVVYTLPAIPIFRCTVCRSSSLCTTLRWNLANRAVSFTRPVVPGRGAGQRVVRVQPAGAFPFAGAPGGGYGSGGGAFPRSSEGGLCQWDPTGRYVGAGRNDEFSGKIALDHIARSRGWDTLQRLDSKTILDERFNAVNYPFFAFSKGRLVLAYKNYKRLEYYALSPEGRLDFVRAVGKDYDRSEVAEMKKKRTPMDGPVDVAWGENQLYLLENAVNERGELLASRVEVFDWEGNGRYRLRLERPATKILVDEAGGAALCDRPGVGFFPGVSVRSGTVRPLRGETWVVADREEK